MPNLLIKLVHNSEQFDLHNDNYEGKRYLMYTINNNFGECTIKIANRTNLQPSFKQFSRATRRLNYGRMSLSLEFADNIIEDNSEIPTVMRNVQRLFVELSKVRTLITSVAIVNSGPKLEIPSLLNTLRRKNIRVLTVERCFISETTFLEIFNSSHYPRLIRLELVKNYMFGGIHGPI